MRNAEISIRPATAGDLGQVNALLVESALPTTGVAAAIEDFLVAEAEGSIVGVVGMEYCGAYGLLRSTAVSSAWRNHGIARQLVERIIAAAESRGVHALYLLTTTAEHYFPSFGFTTTTRDVVPEEIRATEEFKTACPASATTMCLPLPCDRSATATAAATSDARVN